MSMDAGRFLDMAEARFPHKTAMTSRGRRYTYCQLKDRVSRLMTGLASIGIKKGERVATLMWNCSQMLEIHLAAMRLGAVFTPFNFRLTGSELAFLINDSRPKVLVCDETCQDLAAETAGQYKGEMRLYSTSEKPGGDLQRYENLIEDNRELEGSISLLPDDACQLLYTSGTTANPKGVVLTHQNVIWNAINMIHARRDRSDDVTLVVAPLFHAAALNSHFVPRLALGSTMIIEDRFDPQRTMELIEKERVTVLPGNPTLFIMLLEHCAVKRYNTSSVTRLTSGSDKLPEHVKQALIDLFPRAGGIFDIYGLTEAGPCVTCLDAADSLRKTACVGPVLPFVQARLLDDAGDPVASGEIGELAVRGPNVMKGYWGLPEETRNTIRDGWLYTGDLARADEEDFYYIVDRKKDMMVSGGENVSAREVEEVLFCHPAVVKAAVFGLPDQRWGEAVTAAVIVREGQQVTAEQIQLFARQRLAGYKVPKRVVFANAFPESGAGKVQKNLLKKRYAQ